MRNPLKSKIAKNASWIIIGRVVQALLGLVVSMFTARYLGPGNYGLISYAHSLVGFVMPVVFLGMNNTLVHELTTDQSSEGEIIGTSIIMSLMSSIICMIGVFTFTFFVNADEKATIIVSVLYSFILIFQVLDLVRYWFQSKLLSKYSAIVSLISYVIVSLYKIFLLITHKSVYWFAVSNTIDYLIISISLLVIYHKLGGQKLAFSLNRAKSLFSKSKHYIVTGLMVAIFAQTDKIMLKLMLGETATGFYSAASTCAAMTGFIFTAIIDSFRPEIFKSYSQSTEKFELNMKRLYSVIIYISLAQSLVMTVFAPIIIHILYGSQYNPSITALQIITWFTTFSYMGSVRNIWILSKNLQKYLWIINLSGAALNVILNAILIPHFGINGASFASFMTQFFTNFIIGFIILPIKDNNILIIKAINPKYLLSLIK